MRHFIAAAWVLVLSGMASAEGISTGAQISVELNTVNQVEAGCQLTFLTSSAHDTGVEKVVFETVLIDASGAVTLLTLFDFGSLPPGRPRVRQFVIPQQQCSALGSVLINGVATCSVSDLDDTACEAGLTVTSRTDVELIG
ncbi:MAG: hypothetical protein AAF601_02450 [Pseudomonadota bacterium]